MPERAAVKVVAMQEASYGVTLLVQWPSVIYRSSVSESLGGPHSDAVTLVSLLP